MKKVFLAGMMMISSLAHAAESDRGAVCKDPVTVYLGEVDKSHQASLTALLQKKGQKAVLNTRSIPLRSAKVYKLEEGGSAYVFKGSQKTVTIFDEKKLTVAVQTLNNLEAKIISGTLSDSDKKIRFSEIFEDVLISQAELDGVSAEVIVRFSPFEALNYFGQDKEPILDVVSGTAFEIRADVDLKSVRARIQKEISQSTETMAEAKDSSIGSTLSLLALGIIQSLENGSLIDKDQKAMLYKNFIQTLENCKAAQ